MESSYEERWEAMLSLLDLQSVLEGDAGPELDADCWHWQHNATSAAATAAVSSQALMHNVSMTQPIASSAAILSPSTGKNFAVIYVILLFTCYRASEMIGWVTVGRVTF